MKKYPLLIYFLFSFSFCDAQLMYSKIFGDSTNNYSLNKVIATSDGGLLVSGLDHVNAGDNKLVLIKLNINGDTTWTTILMNIYYWAVPSLVELPNQNGYIICGSTSDFYPARGFLCNVDINGNVNWTKAYSDDTTNTFTIDDMVVTIDDSLIVACRTAPGLCTLMKTDFSGNVGWVKNINEGSDVQLKLLRAQNNDLIFSSGHKWQSSSRAFLMRVDGNGNLQWSKAHGMMYHYYPHVSFMDTTGNGQFIMTVTVSDVYGFPYMCYMKVDANGNVLWQRSLSGVLTMYSNAKTYSLSGNRYGIIGDGEPFGLNTFVITTDSSGIPITARVDTAWHTSNPSFAKTINHQLAFIGRDRDTTGLKNKIKIFLADSLGNTFCNQIIDSLVVDTNQTFSFSNVNTILTSSSIQIFNMTMMVNRGIPVFTDCTNSVLVPEFKKFGEINSFPNPFSTAVTLHFPSSQNSFAHLTILNSVGEVVVEKEIKLEDQILDLASLPEGIYLLSVLNNEVRFIQKIVK